jgi:ubiquinone/menaquinone biosynthesis C-methylase UbiE
MFASTIPLTHLERLRRAELATVASWFKPRQRVLELGAGSGYQASLLAKWGCDVTALDIGTRPQSERTYYPVHEYDGRAIPLSDSSIDVVFTSHVLEHIDPLARFLTETHRVMRRNAVAIHILPSSTWRMWTSLAHYPFVLQTLVSANAEDSLVNVGSARDATDRHGVVRAISKAIVHPFVAHGSHHNAAVELREFTKRRWANVFSQNGFAIISVKPSRLFYTGYGLFARMSLAKRQRMSVVLGSSSHAFVLRKIQGAPSAIGDASSADS